MSDVCALEGCAEPIEPQPEGAPPRKYCSQAHRTAARARRAVARRVQDPVPDPSWEPDDLDVPGPEDDDEPAFQRIGAAVRRVVDEHDEQDMDAMDDLDAGAGRGRTGDGVDSRSGRESTPVSGSGDAGAAVVASRANAAVSRQPVPLRALRRRPAWATPRTAVAAGLAAAMVLGGGTAMIGIDRPATPEALTPPPLPPGGPEWLGKANLALASTDTQLQTIDAAQQRWQAAAATHRSAVEPPEVKALEARKAYLESERSILASQIGAWQNLQQNNAALSSANAQLSSLTRAADQPGQPADVQQQIAAQRATLQNRSRMLADQAGTWQQDVARASTAPMPDTTPDTTTSVVSRVDGLDTGRRPSTPPVGDQGESGSILAGRSPNSGDKERDLPGTGAPPRPDGGSTHTSVEAGSSHGGLGDAVDAVAGPVTDTVRGAGLLGDGNGRQGGAGGAGGAGKGHDDDSAAGGGHGHGHGLGATVGRVGGAVEPTVSEPAVSLLGMRTVGDLVGKAMDARQDQDQDQHGDGSAPAKGSAAAGGAHHSAVMTIGGTTYRVGVPTRSGTTRQPGAGSRQAAGKVGSSSKAGGASTDQQVRAAVTSWAKKLAVASTGKGSAAEGSGSKSSSSTSLLGLIAKYSSAGGGSSLEDLKARHSSSKSYTTKDSGSKDSGSKASGSKDSGSKSHTTKVSSSTASNSTASSSKGSGSKGSGSKGSGSTKSG